MSEVEFQECRNELRKESSKSTPNDKYLLHLMRVTFATRQQKKERYVDRIVVRTIDDAPHLRLEHYVSTEFQNLI